MSESSGYDFASHLARFGPDALASLPAPVTLAEARRYTRSIAKAHYENFPVLGWLSPAPLQPHFASVYAFCRWADDLGDEVGDPNRAVALLDWWKGQVDDAYSGVAKHPVMIALSDTIERFGIPKEPWLDLISAFRQDQFQSRYRTTSELLDYCRRSANPVGRVVLHLVGCPTPDRLALSDSICTGLQWANFCQDVAVDYFEKGRLYLPQSTLKQHGVTEGMIQKRDCTREFKAMMAEEVGRAETFLRVGLPLVRTLEGRFRLAVSLFAHGGLAILRRIRAVDYNVLSARPRLSGLDRAGALARALAGLAVAKRVPRGSDGQGVVAAPPE